MTLSDQEVIDRITRLYQKEYGNPDIRPSNPKITHYPDGTMEMWWNGGMYNPIPIMPLAAEGLELVKFSYWPDGGHGATMNQLILKERSA